MENLSIFEKLSLSTIRIECLLQNGSKSSGTGFFMKFFEMDDSYVPAIITNKHVIAGAESGSFLFTLTDENGNPDYKRHHKFEISNFQKPWVDHPDKNVDLCAMPISTFIEVLNNKGIKPFITFLDSELLPKDQDIEKMAGLERVVMVGYPNGLWDAKNNQPVFRSGVLASHYKFDWNNRPEFLIDASCVPGSSGSPVLLIDIGQVYTKKGIEVGRSRIKFLGVLYAGPVLSADGTVQIIPAPVLNTLQTSTNIPINLGYVIKSTKLTDFDKLFKLRLSQKK